MPMTSRRTNRSRGICASSEANATPGKAKTFLNQWSGRIRARYLVISSGPEDGEQRIAQVERDGEAMQDAGRPRAGEPQELPGPIPEVVAREEPAGPVEGHRNEPT